MVALLIEKKVVSITDTTTSDGKDPNTKGAIEKTNTE